MSHTPGPWEASWAIRSSEKPEDHYGWTVNAGDESEPEICIIPDSERLVGCRMANARLIATAPAMLDLLKRLYQWDQLPECLDGPFWHEEIGKMIAKATGE